MQLPTWTADQAQAFLRAMKSVATQGGGAALAPIEREMLGALQAHVLHCRIDLDGLEAIDPATLAKLVPEPAQRRELVQFAVLMPYLPMEVCAAKVAVVDRLACALGVATETVTDLHRVRDHRLRRLAFDYLRRCADGFAPARTFGGRVKYFAELVRQYRGEPLLAARYQRLADLPVGTLGRTFHDFYRARRLPLPGERGSFTEALVAHDMTHILGGYDTDMDGEVEVGAFEAGMVQKPIGWEMLLDAILDFHCGIAFTTANAIEPGRGHFHPERALAAYERGSGCNANLLFDWDWWSVLDEPVDALRERYGIRAAGGAEIPTPGLDDAPVEPLRATGS